MELLHYTLHFEWSRNGERDYPQSAGRNGLMSHSKVSGLKRRGNLLCLLCLSHTDTIKPKLHEKITGAVNLNKHVIQMFEVVSLNGGVVS
jgi:hypothetical protein